jgi:hypothetical protein
MGMGTDGGIMISPTERDGFKVGELYIDGPNVGGLNVNGFNVAGLNRPKNPASTD